MLLCKWCTQIQFAGQSVGATLHNLHVYTNKGYKCGNITTLENMPTLLRSHLNLLPMVIDGQYEGCMTSQYKPRPLSRVNLMVFPATCVSCCGGKSVYFNN